MSNARIANSLALAQDPPTDRIVLWEPFDGDTLDPAWEVSSEGATNWDIRVNDSELQIFDVVSPSPSGFVVLRRDLPLELADFKVDMPFIYQSGQAETMQRHQLSLLGPNEEIIAQVFYQDDWVGHHGLIWITAGDEHWTTGGPGTAPPNGDFAFQFVREGDQVRIVWDGDAFLTGTSAVPLSRILIRAGRDMYPDGWMDRLLVSQVLVTTPESAIDACPVDLAEPFGVLDFSDVLAFLNGFQAGCP